MAGHEGGEKLIFGHPAGVEQFFDEWAPGPARYATLASSTTSSSSSNGQTCLSSRSLCETGKRLVTRTCYAWSVHAGDDAYDDVPYAELIFAEVDWSEATEHVRNRSGRLGRSDEFDVEPEWATEALADPRRLAGSAGSCSGLTVKVLGWSPSTPAREPGQRGRLLKVIVAPKDHLPAGRWWGATAMEANEADQRRYEEEP